MGVIPARVTGRTWRGDGPDTIGFTRGAKMVPMQSKDARKVTVKNTILTCMVAGLLFACGQKQETATNSSTSSTPAVATATQAAPAAMAVPPPATGSAAPAAQPPSQGKVTGKVVEAFNTAGYTYLHLKTAKGDEWAAVPESAVKQGDTVTVNIQMTAAKFESKTLKRKFDEIYFGNLEGAGAPGVSAMAMQGMPPGHPGAAAGATGNAGAMGSPSEHMQAPVVGDVKVEKAAGGKTVAEIWAGRNGLKGNDVVVRGKVVKFLAGIMGKNWMHLQDGSGSKDKGDDDIAVTTNDVAAVGDVVVVKGKVSVDKDFGAGYRYPVIVENAKVSK